MSFTHMGAVAGMASPDSSSSQMYRRGVLIHCPPEYSVDIVPPVKEGSSWHYGLRVKPLMGFDSSSAVDAKGRRIKVYEIHRKWEDCLDLQRVLEKEYASIVKARKGGKKIYGGRPERAASFDSLPTGPDPKSIPNDIHAFIPRLAAKSSLFRGASGSALVQQRSQEFNEFISALFAPGTPVLIDEVRHTPAVREWFGFWRRDRDAMRRRDGDRASVVPSARRLSMTSDTPPNSTGQYASSPLAQTSYESSPISADQEPRQSYETTYGDLAEALDTFPMPPTPSDGPVSLEPFPKSAATIPSSGFVPIVQRRLGAARNDAARNSTFRNAQFFSAPPTSPLPPLPISLVGSDEGGYGSDTRRKEPPRSEGRPRRATSPSWSSTSTHLTRPTSTSPRSSQTSDWSMSAMAQALVASASERDLPLPPSVPADERSEIEYMRQMSLSSLSSNSSKRPPPIPPRSSLRRSTSSSPQAQKHVPDVPAVVCNDEQEPEFEIVTHSVLNSYLDDNRSSMLSSEFAVSSTSGSSVRRSMTPSIASAYSTTSSVGSTGAPVPSTTQPTNANTTITASPLLAVPANEILVKAACPVGDSIVLARIPRTLSLEGVRSVLATKFRQAAGVQLDLLEHGFVLGYLGAPPLGRSGRPGTAGGRPGTGGGPAVPARSSGRPGTAPGRTRSSSLSSMAACVDPTHLTLIVTQRDWENAVAKHGDKITVRVLLAGSD